MTTLAASGALPNVLIVGAMKCGTTSLHHYLDLHPDISMSEKKELRFFDDPNWSQRIDWYRQQFSRDASATGESTVYYTAYPWIGGVPARIHSLVPEARLIYLVGDPIKRICAQWAEWQESEADRDRRMLGKWAGRSLSEALEDYDNPRHPVVCPSRYATQLEQYLDLFPQSQILVVDQTELRDEREATLERIFRFLEVDPGFRAAEFSSELNRHEDKRVAYRSYSAIRRGLLAGGVGRLPAPVRGVAGKTLRAAFSRPLTRPTISETVSSDLRRHLRDEVDRLRSLTGQEFAGWSV